MTDVAAKKPGFFKSARPYVVAGLLFVGWEYLRSGQGRLDFRVLPGELWATIAALACTALGLLLVLTDLLERLPWQGVVRKRIEGGYGWSETIVSRLPVPLLAFGLIWLGTGFFAMAVQAFYQSDWGRLAVCVLFIFCASWMVLPLLSSAFSARPVLVLDGEGLYCAYGDLPWSAIEKIGAGHDPADRDVYLYLNTGSALGPAQRLSLADAGVTAGEFLARVEELSPGTVIERSEPPLRAFG